MYENSFEWDLAKSALNLQKHRINFEDASEVFKDHKLVILLDDYHSSIERRMFAIGKCKDKILTVRFVYRGYKIRILGAGFWRKGVRIYEKENR